MSHPVILRPAAEADVDRIRADLDAVRLGVVWQDVRAARLRRFKHVVYYIVYPGRVEVIAVLHGSRDSSAWRSRA